MSDYDDEIPCCDWCDKETKRRSLVMGYHHGNDEDFLWGKGDLICSSCLKKIKSKSYTVKYSGRQMFASSAYYEKYWKNDGKATVLRTPEDNAEAVDDDQQPSSAKKKRKKGVQQQENCDENTAQVSENKRPKSKAAK